MVNDSECKTIRTWNVKIKMFDGIVRTLINVRRVPNLINNLVSITVLEDISCAYNRGNGIMNVKKDIMIVLKGKRVGKQIGETVIDHVAPTNTDDNDNATFLWHLWLGHMNERLFLNCIVIISCLVLSPVI